MKGMGVGHDIHIGPAQKNLRMDGPFRMPPTPTFKLFTLKAHQDEVLGAQDLAQTNAVAFEPETAPVRVAQGHMAQRHVAMTFHL